MPLRVCGQLGTPTAAGRPGGCCNKSQNRGISCVIAVCVYALLCGLETLKRHKEVLKGTEGF